MQSSTIHLEMGSIISVIGRGWTAQSGTGAANASGGAGHGGYGGGTSGAGKGYGSYYSPNLPGSGGGSNAGVGGSGGGTIMVGWSSLTFCVYYFYNFIQFFQMHIYSYITIVWSQIGFFAYIVER